MDRIARLKEGLKSRVPIDIRAFWGFGAFKFTMRGSAVRKIAKVLRLTRNSLDLTDFLKTFALTLERLRVNYP